MFLPQSRSFVKIRVLISHPESSTSRLWLVLGQRLAFRFLTDNGLFSWVLLGEANSSVVFLRKFQSWHWNLYAPKPTSSQPYSPCFVVRHRYPSNCRQNPSNLPWSHTGHFYGRNHRTFYHQIFPQPLPLYIRLPFPRFLWSSADTPFSGSSGLDLGFATAFGNGWRFWDFTDLDNPLHQLRVIPKNFIPFSIPSIKVYPLWILPWNLSFRICH